MLDTIQKVGHHTTLQTKSYDIEMDSFRSHVAFFSHESKLFENRYTSRMIPSFEFIQINKILEQNILGYINLEAVI